jgi:D-beta-D-heptose 7-phosphate kinase/D-beta-D-heptose 1-phosphate adenosyltransferase
VSRAPLVIVGDLMLDREVLGTVDRVCPEAPVPVLDQTQVLDRPGGAGLAALFAVAAAAGPGPAFLGQATTGHDHAVPGRAAREVILVTAVSDDDAGDRLRELLGHSGVRLIEVPLLGPTPEKIRLRAGEHLLMRLDRGCGPSEIGVAPAAAIAAIRQAGAILVSDYGRGVSTHPQLRAALTERAHCVPVVWDPHPRGAHPVPTTRLVTPNRSEAAGFVALKLDATHSGEWPLTTALHAYPTGGEAGHGGANGNGHLNGHGNGNGRANGNGRGSGYGTASTAELAQAAGTAVRLRRYWGANAVVVTLADQGAVLSDGVHPPLLIPAPFTARGDSCGAGDRFAAAAIAALAEGSSVLEAVTTSVAAATAYVAAGGALALCPELHEPTDRQIIAILDN